eukprot:TRINITY_DN7549_c0_g1_i1.p1 TRINITY_DN7549_c0_g1~~TRINITY_DN7549_c0_g1_i1.p1  ORF type:complete len:210 (+),score=36.35 TRINITY_DN7549_c0_g1_i1:62-631(+)
MSEPRRSRRKSKPSHRLRDLEEIPSPTLKRKRERDTSPDGEGDDDVVPLLASLSPVKRTRRGSASGSVSSAPASGLASEKGKKSQSKGKGKSKPMGKKKGRVVVTAATSVEGEGGEVEVEAVEMDTKKDPIHIQTIAGRTTSMQFTPKTSMYNFLREWSLGPLRPFIPQGHGKNETLVTHEQKAKWMDT